MTRLPLEERRQIFLARQRASQAMLEPTLEPGFAQPLQPGVPSNRRVRLVVNAVVIAMLVGAGLIFLSTVTFHLPTSLLEALLPWL